MRKSLKMTLGSLTILIPAGAIVFLLAMYGSAAWGHGGMVAGAALSELTTESAFHRGHGTVRNLPLHRGSGHARDDIQRDGSLPAVGGGIPAPGEGRYVVTRKDNGRRACPFNPGWEDPACHFMWHVMNGVPY